MSTASLTRPLPVFLTEGRFGRRRIIYAVLSDALVSIPPLSLSLAFLLSLFLSTVVRWGCAATKDDSLLQVVLQNLCHSPSRTPARRLFPWLCRSLSVLSTDAQLSRYTSASLIPSLSAFRLHVCLFSLPFTPVLCPLSLLYLASRQSSRSSLMNSLS